MPTIAPSFTGTENATGGPAGPRRDGWVRVLDYDHDKQAWENADVNDYAKTGGQNKDRRWEEGSSTLETHYGGVTRYYLTYSANNWQTPAYGVGYAVATNPLGPFRKFPRNPILHQKPAIGEYSTGHGSIVASPDGTQLFYPHHGRPSSVADQRRLYIDEMLFSFRVRDPWGDPTLSIDQATSDRPVPSGVAPYTVTPSARKIVLRPGQSAPLRWQVLSANGASLALENPLNRVRTGSNRPSVATLVDNGGGYDGTIKGLRPGRAVITIIYQRKSASGAYRDVHQGRLGRRALARVTVIVRRVARR